MDGNQLLTLTHIRVVNQAGFRLAVLVREVPRDSWLTCIRLDTTGTCQQPILCFHMGSETENREPGQRRHAAVRNA